VGWGITVVEERKTDQTYKFFHFVEVHKMLMYTDPLEAIQQKKEGL
jgi:hypothetical protein